MPVPRIAPGDDLSDYPAVQNAVADEVDRVAAIADAVADDVAGAPAALNSFVELSAALGDDADLAANMAAAIAALRPRALALATFIGG